MPAPPRLLQPRPRHGAGGVATAAEEYRLSRLARYATRHRPRDVGGHRLVHLWSYAKCALRADVGGAAATDHRARYVLDWSTRWNLERSWRSRARAGRRRRSRSRGSLWSRAWRW